MGRLVTGGELMLAEVGAVHRFVSLTADVAAWVLLWGPAGGAAATV